MASRGNFIREMTNLCSSNVSPNDREASQPFFQPLSGQSCNSGHRMCFNPLNGRKTTPLSGQPCRIDCTPASSPLNGFADAHLADSPPENPF